MNLSTLLVWNWVFSEDEWWRFREEKMVSAERVRGDFKGS